MQFILFILFIHSIYFERVAELEKNKVSASPRHCICVKAADSILTPVFRLSCRSEFRVALTSLVVDVRRILDPALAGSLD